MGVLPYEAGDAVAVFVGGGDGQRAAGVEVHLDERTDGNIEIVRDSASVHLWRR